MSYFNELTNAEEKRLFQESCELFDKIMSGLKAKGLLRTTIIRIDVDRLVKIWDNSRHFGIAFNRMVDKFKNPEITAEVTKKGEIEQYAMGFTFYS